jgi:hypothetical protein
VSLPGVSSERSARCTRWRSPGHLTHRTGSSTTGRYQCASATTDRRERVEVAFPYRSTLKKIEARRVGPIAGGLEGSLAILPPYRSPTQGRGEKVTRGFIQGRS